MDLPDGELRGKVGPWAAFDDFAQCVAPLALGCAEKGERGGGGRYLNWKNERGRFVFVMSSVLLTHGRMYLSAPCKSPHEVPETCLVKHGTTSMSLPHHHSSLLLQNVD